MDTDHFLKDLVKDAGEPGFRAEPWYNKDGDCLIYKGENVAVVARRVDSILTLYESAESGHVIGFKIKGVRHLLSPLCHGVMAVGAVTDQTGQILSVAMVVIHAFSRERPTIARQQGYAEALGTLGENLRATPLEPAMA